VFLQCLVEVDELFRPGTRGAHPGKEVLLHNLSMDMIGITFRAHLPKGTLKSRQSILPRSDGAFPAIQLSLPSKELLLQLDGHHRRSHHV
jgi:hypothetical protein